MANSISNVSFRIDSEPKNSADKLFSELVLNMTTAFNIFLRQSVREWRIPFEISLYTPNTGTAAAMKEAERIAHDSTTKRYKSVNELMANFNDEI